MVPLSNSGSEDLEIGFKDVVITYASQDARGKTGPTTKAGWDVKQNAKT